MLSIHGELERRITANIDRLSVKEYQAPKVFGSGGDWEGDWEGRTMLALACQYNSTTQEQQKKQTLSQLQNIISSLDEHTNKDGYFGELFDGKVCNEQQVSGNSWYLRGLCESYLITKDEEIKSRLEKIANNYLLKLTPFYKSYPLIDREEEGGVAGHLKRVAVDGWYLSSDIGCAFMMLDGITALYKILQDKKIAELTELMIDKFMSLDFVGKNCQTHATLSCTRGIMRYYKMTKQKKYLDMAINNFDLYVNYGCTKNFANYNWFGRPFWTEPCAVVDSLIVAKNLFLETNDYKYAQFVSRAYHNAIRMCQRKNGGAGCETCLDENNDILQMHLYEAFFCCSMRIAEGFKNLVDFAFLQNKSQITIPQIYTSFSTAFDNVKIDYVVTNDIKTAISLQVETDKTLDFKIYVPQGASVKTSGVDKSDTKDGFICFVLHGSAKVEIEYSYEPKREKAIMYGDFLLTEKLFDYNPNFVVEYENRTLSPIVDFMETEKFIEADKIIQKI